MAEQIIKFLIRFLISDDDLVEVTTLLKNAEQTID